MPEKLLIRVDEHDNPVGFIEKMKAHREGILHRAFSVFLFTGDGRWIVQQRALTKYHSAGLWSNSCCGHPLEGEDTMEAAVGRLRFEMGLECRLRAAFSFVYRADLDSGLTEHEFDHVFVGLTDELPRINPDEVVAWQWMDTEVVRRNIPHFTKWFQLIYERVQEHVQHHPLL